MGMREGEQERYRVKVRLVDFFNLAVFAMLFGVVSEGWIM